MKRQIKTGLTPIAAAVAVLSIGFATPAIAQQTTANNEAQSVVVTGIRASLQNAANIKRTANAIVDAVSAEDIGKLPDSDVGQALGRIPGVSVGRSFGQGSSVSIRGSDPQMTYTTLNGQTIASTGWYDQLSLDRSFNYSLLPPELIGGMEVYKSSQADLTEGGIGGTVIVKSRRPLDLAANTAIASLRLGKGTVSTDLNKELSGLFSWKNSANTFGVLVSAGNEKGDYTRRGIEADMRWSNDVTPSTFVQERERKAFNINLQARPIKDLELGVNYLKLELKGDNANSSHYVFQGDNCSQKNALGLCVKSTITAANATNPFTQTWARKATMTSDSLVVNAGLKGDGYKLDLLAGSTKANGGTNLTTNYGYSVDSVGQSLPKWTGTIDASGKQVIMTPSSNQSVSVGNLGTTSDPSGAWATKRGPNSDAEEFLQADLKLNLDWGMINSFKAGARYTEHTFEKNTELSVFNSKIVGAPTSSLYNGSIKMGTPGWAYPRANIEAMAANTLQNVNSWVVSRSGYAKLEENNTSFYGMFNFEQDKWHGNFGLRYISTEAKGTGYKFDGTPLAAGDLGDNTGWSKSLTSKKGTYSDVLPSINAAYDFDKNTIFRISASQAITRPNFDNMFLAQQNGYNDDRVGNESMTYGNVSLKPMKSTQFDFGVEYYYGKGSLVSLNFFHKDINNFITTNVKTNQSIGVVSPNSNKDSWTVNEYVNAGGGKINGIEAQINHSFDNGFGAFANYTYADATAPASSFQDRLNVFTLSSKHNANLVGYYENQTYSARLAYNYRSKYMIRETAYYYGDRWHDAFGTLDASFGWNVTDKVRVSLDVTNILQADDVQYGAAAANIETRTSLKAGFPTWSFMGERTYRLSVTAKF